MNFIKLGLIGLALLPLRAACAQERPAPAPTWNREPVEVLSPTRAQIRLNGLWKFAPAPDGELPADEKAWGTIWVPGAWGGKNPGLLPGIAQNGEGANCQAPADTKLSDFIKAQTRAWYERPLSIPANWAGRRITLDFARIATDAQVRVNGVDCGRVASPGGAVEITRAVQPGQTDTLTYFRFTRWRQTRALSQVLANLGATFAADANVFGAATAPFYHPDYRADFALGDDPHRYYRW